MTRRTEVFDFFGLARGYCRTEVKGNTFDRLLLDNGLLFLSRFRK